MWLQVRALPGAGCLHSCPSVLPAQTRMPLSLAKMLHIWLLSFPSPLNRKKGGKKQSQTKPTNPITQLCPLNKQLPKLYPQRHTETLGAWGSVMGFLVPLPPTTNAASQQPIECTGGEKEYILINRGEKWFWSCGPVSLVIEKGEVVGGKGRGNLILQEIIATMLISGIFNVP